MCRHKKRYNTLKIAYFDCFSGISGEHDTRCFGLMQACHPKYLQMDWHPSKLDAEFSLHFEKSVKHGITGTRAIVEVHPAHTSSHEAAAHRHTHDHGHSHHHHEHGPSRHLSDIFKLLDDSDLDAEVRDTAKTRL